MFEKPLAGIQHSSMSFQENVQDEFGYAIIEKIYNPIADHLLELCRMENNVLEELNSIQSTLNEARSIL